MCVEKVLRETFSRVSNVAHKIDKDERASDKLSIQIQTCFEFEWLTKLFYPSILHTNEGVGKGFA